MDYHVAVGLSYRTKNLNTEEMVREAEVRMYEAKAQYYQEKETKHCPDFKNGEYVCIKTGIPEIDALISVLKDKYNGIYRVSLESDTAQRILMPAYLGYNENEKNFSSLLTKYIEDSVSHEYHRVLTGFLNYDAIKKQLMSGNIPTVKYKKTNGDAVTLCVYKLSDDDVLVRNTLWVFARD